MKKYIVLFVILVMTITQCACETDNNKNVDKTSDKIVDKIPDKTESKSGEVSITTSMPDGWEKNEESVLAVQYSKGTASFMVTDEPFSSKTLDEVVNDAADIFGNTFDNFTKVGEIESLTIDGKDAKKLTFTCTISSLNMKFMYVYLFAADKVYAITFGDMESSFDTLTEDYNSILSSIRFTEQ